MEFFIDTADVAEIKAAHELGILDGVTTNPSLIAKTGKPFKAVVKEICAIVDGPVSAEVVATEKDAILKEGRELAKLAKNVVVKVPLIAEGLKAVKVFSAEGIKTNVTLCFSTNQALLAAKAGATYISPFVGRLDDISQDGMELIDEIKTVYDNYDFATKILVASIRHPIHLKQAALIGAHVATIPFSVFGQLVKHPLTDSGLEKFLADAKKFNWD
ncbi:fructose-6-phosphate aldolase [Turneriella parva]|uniref:Probable transaldolase n=1 Tax=Turneriella parva (strain ATCC BAA-1111 / DSM 21527 / NCTC 11395 / H) TaxID=869212 RepID=I4B5L6_TURPD|nr:fructose-6-phosphate aldolase [Turneriella parva]AFM12573.1 transaldolase [Turneriella parva DSM 21527]